MDLGDDDNPPKQERSPCIHEPKRTEQFAYRTLKGEKIFEKEAF